MTYREQIRTWLRHRSSHALLGILAVAGLLRFWGISFGMPYDFTPDEVHEIVRALKLGAGEYTWEAGKGGLYYFLFAEYGLLFVFWWIAGFVSGPTDFAFRYIQDPTAFYLLGRATVALMGVATCLVVYAIGKRTHNAAVGLAAATLGATAYFHAVWSHYINVDIGLTLAIWGSVLAFIHYERTERTRWLIVAGALSGVAVAFKLPGLIALPLLALFVATPFKKWTTPRKVVREMAIVIIASIGTVGVIAPENYGAVLSIPEHFSYLLEPEQGDALQDPTDADLDGEIHELTQFRGPGYIEILLYSTNIAVTIFALLGAAIAVRRKERWGVAWAGLTLVFLGVMSAADRTGTERYILPIVPALWLLASAALSNIGRGRPWAIAAGVVVISAFPVVSLLKHNYMWTRPDTRVIAKDWIEANVPSGAKVLMDGMEYRFIQSPPLVPDDATVERTVTRGKGGRAGSRGISDSTLELYAKAMAQLNGPRYELHSTIHGLAVRELSHYSQECFDYIVTSSEVADYFLRPETQEDYPLAASFYKSLPQHPDFRQVYSIEPQPWKIQGPRIVVYEVVPTRNDERCH